MKTEEETRSTHAQRKGPVKTEQEGGQMQAKKSLTRNQTY